MICIFQSTLPRGERQLHIPFGVKNGNFNPRSREGSDHRLCKIRTCQTIFQSTLPRGERRICGTMLCSDVNISIHAPARGATTMSYKLMQNIRISIHAPARGATKAGMRYSGGL